MKNILLIGAGRDHTLRFRVGNTKDDLESDYRLTTLDINADHKTDIVADLEQLPYSWGADEEYDEIHAYETLEHTGQQGDWKFFFDQFSELHRILKPGGMLVGTVPMWNSKWAWGDPSHKRVISAQSLTYLSQYEYERQIGKTRMSDFRFYYKADFEVMRADENESTLVFVLRRKVA